MLRENKITVSKSRGKVLDDWESAPGEDAVIELFGANRQAILAADKPFPYLAAIVRRFEREPAQASIEEPFDVGDELQRRVDDLREVIRAQRSATAAWKFNGRVGGFPVAHESLLFADEQSWGAYEEWLAAGGNELSTGGRLNDFAEFQRRAQDGA